ncbi:PREDICTED: polyamine-modulated factor 1 isoform X2 [Galeopterus variegatus]|uniref:Polyamine-modulated factor 1 isoform X2 n=1 Tax=Galeopterus variegatus TaxID=482537 RepID=A0ABM0QKG0_GALVR|nr:PREDICTED: polyamine-modulated factor 1 isoform X2 [Galeopterus variegatus]
MAEACSANLGSGSEKRRPEGSSPESVTTGTSISRVKLLDTMVDTFLQKLVAAGSSPLLYQGKSAGPRPPSGGQPVKHVFSWTACGIPRGRPEEISEIKEEGNLEAVLNTLDKIVEEGKDRKEPAWRPSGIPEEDLCRAMAPYFLQQRDTLQHRVQKQEAENRQLADAVLAGRRQVEKLQLQVQAQQQAWQALHREQRELMAVLREPE